jgi:hypothetical protein
LKKEIGLLSVKKEAYSLEKKLLFKDESIGGVSKGVNVSEIEKASAFFSKRYIELSMELFEIEKTRKVIEENIDDKVACKELNIILEHQKNLLNHFILNNLFKGNNEVSWMFAGKVQDIKNKKEFKNIEEYEIYRDNNAKKELTAKELKMQEIKRLKEEKEEQMRLERLKKYDNKIGLSFEKANRLFIK